MPNPLLGGRINTSRRRDAERPTPITPVPEDYAGDNIPYRGVVPHGAPVKDDWRDPETDMPVRPDGRLVDVYEHEEPAPAPIPVRIIGSDSDERPTFRTMRMHLRDGVPVLLLGRDYRRQTVTIRNDTAGKFLLIANAQDQIQMNAYRLAQANFSGLTLGKGGAEDIWVASEDGTEMDVTVVWETSIG